MRGGNHVSSFTEREDRAWEAEGTSSGPQQLPRFKSGSPGLRPWAELAAGPPGATAGRAWGQPSLGGPPHTSPTPRGRYCPGSIS